MPTLQLKRKHIALLTLFHILALSSTWAQPTTLLPNREWPRLGPPPAKVEMMEPVRKEEEFSLEEEPDKRAKAAEDPTSEEGKANEGQGLEAMINEYVEFGGAIEVETFWLRGFDDHRVSDISLETAELDFEITVTDWAIGILGIEFFPEEDKITVKEAFVRFAQPECFPWFLEIGRLFVPFGTGTGAVVGDTLSISDPLTIEIFETREDVLLFGYERCGWYVGAYVFNGDSNRGGGDDHIEQWGTTIRYGYGDETTPTAMSAGIDFISNVFDSDGLQEELPEALEANYAPGFAAHIRYFTNGFSFIAEFNGAFKSSSFDVDDDELDLAPKAWQIELGYEKEICCRSTYFALNYSESYDLHGVFPRRRFLATAGRWIYDGILVAIEYGHDWDYSESEGGTGKTADSVICQLTYEW